MYKLINKQTGEEHLCEKVVVDGWDYYVSDEKRNLNDFVLLDNRIKELPDYDGYHIIQLLDENLLKSADNLNCKKVIATNNPNIDIPKVVDEVEILVNKLDTPENLDQFSFDKGFIDGYNKSQETHPFSEEDVKEIFKIAQMQKNYGDYKPYTFEEAIQLWKEQRPKTLYYE